MKVFKDRLAVVTGGGSGIGRELVRQLAAQGCHVAMCDLSDQGMAETTALCREQMPEGTQLSTHVCDVSDESSVMAFRDAVLAQHACDHIHLLFNNAGISGGGSFLRDDREQWDKTFAICWGGVYHCCRAFVPLLEAASEARIVNIASVNGFWACMGATTEHTAYSAAKFAVKGFSEALLVDLRMNAPHVKLSVVMPGHIGTNIAKASMQAWSGDPAAMNAEQVARMRDRWARIDPEAASMDDASVRALAAAAAEDFRDKAPTSAAQAAVEILNGVREDRWRILVGEDAQALDAAVRADPEGAYESDFLQPFASVTERN